MNLVVFSRPVFLYLLLLVPLMPLLYGIGRYLRVRRLRRFGDEEMVRRLMPRWSRSRGWVKVVLFSVAFGFFAIGLSRPQIGAKLKEHKAKGAEIMIVLDVSNSMLAQDYSPNRLERAKLAISRSFSVQSENSRAIIVITDGENHEDDPVSVAKDVADMGIKIYTIGVGSAQGKPIPYKGEYLKDKDGNMVVTRLDENTLREIARVGGGAYIHAGNEEFGLNPIIDDIRRLQQEEFSNVVFEEYDEQYMYFFAIALALLALEALVGQRRAKRQLFD